MSRPGPPPTPANWRWRDGPRQGQAVVVDLDGVLADAAGRQHFLRRPQQDWQGFFEAVGEDPVVDEIAVLLHALDERLAVVLLTARPLRVQRQTHEWLVRHDLRWDLLVMRGTADGTLARDFKARTVGELRAAGLEPTLAFEDDRRNVDMFHEHGVPCVYIHSGYYE